MEPFCVEGDFLNKFDGVVNSMVADSGLVGIVAGGNVSSVQVPEILDDLFNGNVGEYSTVTRSRINSFIDGYTCCRWSFREAAILGARALTVDEITLSPVTFVWRSSLTEEHLSMRIISVV